MARLGNYVNIKTGKLDANAASENGKYPFFTCAITPLKIDTYSYDCECVLVAGNGDLNVKYYSGKFDAYQRTYIIESKNKNNLFPRYLYYFLEQYVETLRKESIGGVIKYIKLGNLTEAVIPLHPLTEQHRITALLDKVSDLIAKRRAQLDKQDLLVKAQFVEMFGDPETNPKQWPVLPMAKVCSVGSSKRIYQSEQCAKGVPFWRVSNLIELINTGTAMTDLYIPQERYNELKKQGQVPKAGDILLTSRGTLGQCYIVKKDDVFYFQDGMISWLYQYSENITPLYISYLFTMPGFRKQIESMQAGTTVSYLSIMMIKHLKVMLPSVSLQNEFTDFVKRADEFKLTLSMSLDKLIMLKNKLMEQYF